MTGLDPRAHVVALTSGLISDTSTERNAFSRLTSLLQRTAPQTDLTSVVSHRLPGERLQDAIIDPSAGAALSSAQFRVFRREAPLAADALRETVPDWARGAAIAETVGPMRAEDGRLFWYDFYRIVRLVPVYFAGDTVPAFLFHLRERAFSLTETIDANELLPFLQSRSYALEPGSVWIRASLLAAGAPADGFVGLTISGGSLRFAPPITVQSGRLTIPAAGQCAIRLQLLAQAAAAFSGGSAGRDAASATIALPASVEITLAAGRATITALADSSWTLFGQPIAFTRAASAPAAWVPELSAIIIPCTTSSSTMSVRTVQSPFATPAGQASIARAGWTLPVATIDVAHPTEASGIGGLAVQCANGLSISWRGLRDGPVLLPAPWVALAPGMVLITDAAAVGAQATQRLRLWQESAPPGRSTIDLRYARAGQLTYVASSNGNEVLFARADSTAHLDRPVDVRATPFPIHTLRSLVSLSFSNTQRLVALYDDNILTDALSTDADWLLPRKRAVSLAIRNALFTVTPVNSLLLFGAMRDDEMVERAALWLGFGLYGLLPTLPDPYAANVRGIRQDSFTRINRPTQLLVASVAWEKAADDALADTIRTTFAFAPIGTQAEGILAWTLNAERGNAVTQSGGAGSGATGGTIPGTPNAATAGTFKRRQLTEPIWESLFARFGAEQFALLDVSSNADQMGVSFAFYNPARPPRPDRTDQGDPNAPPAPVNPLEVRDLDLSAQSRFVRAFTVPQISWEPIINDTAPDTAGDPPRQNLLFPNDGGPTRLVNDDITVVPIAPIPVTQHFVSDFTARATGYTAALFTLPYGLRAYAEITRQNQLPGPGSTTGSSVTHNRPEFESGAIVGGIQIRADAPPRVSPSALFRGCTAQMENLHLTDGTPTGTGTLGASVGTIFNEEFFFDGGSHVRNLGVPLTRIDFSGYGASIFSHWEAPDAAIASTSQARFDVFVGRTAHEVIQVRTILYPWGIHVVRTITLFRTSSGYTYRFDSGWQPESDGVFDFSYKVKAAGPPQVDKTYTMPYNFHPGVVRGVFNIRNIHETDAVKPFTTTLNKANGDTYIDQDNIEQKVVIGTTPAAEVNPGVELKAVYFDGDFELDGVVAGATGGRVPSKGILGFVQLKPRGEPLTTVALRDLLNSQLGSIGASLACELDVGASGQRLRVSRVDVSASVEADGVTPTFVVAARGAVVMPKGGSWSMVTHNQGSGEVSPLDANATVPLIRRGLLTNAKQHITNAGDGDLFRLANPIELLRAPVAGTRNFGILQTTGTQKALFRLPQFARGVDQLLGGVPPEFADSYRLINTKGIFPNVQDAVPLALGAFKTRIIDEGYKLLDELNPTAALEQLLPPGPLRLIDESYLKIYIEYKGASGAGQSKLKFGLDSAAAVGQQWLSNLGDIGMVVDLGPIERLVTIKGSFDAKHGDAPGFRKPELVFADELQPVVDILTILTLLQGGDYAAAMAKGLEVAMSNGADSWNYAFHARKEFPLVQFPPGEAYNAPTNPFKIQARLALGAYFNESLSPTTDIKQLLPTAGAYLEFGGSLSVMCVSVAAATVYAIGSVDLRISGDTKAGPGLAMKFGFGAEIIVGLPVVGNVSITYMVGVDVSIDLTQITVSAFLLFKGRAELLAGLVCITIQIEARGTYKRLAGPPKVTNMSAQVTFSIDVSIFLIINLHFSQSWQEQRQIA